MFEVMWFRIWGFLESGICGVSGLGLGVTCLRPGVCHGCHLLVACRRQDVFLSVSSALRWDRGTLDP